MVELQQFSVVRFGRSDWNILLWSLLFWGTNNSNENLDLGQAFFYEVNLLCSSCLCELKWYFCAAEIAQTLEFGSTEHFSWVNVEFKVLTKFSVLVVCYIYVTCLY